MDGQINDRNLNDSADNRQSQETDSESFYRDLRAATQGENLSSMRAIQEGFSLHQESDDEQ